MIVMQLRVRVLPSGKDQIIDLEEGADGFRLLDFLQLNPEAHLILKETKPIPVDGLLRDGDRISVVSVISGG